MQAKHNISEVYFIVARFLVPSLIFSDDLTELLIKLLQLSWIGFNIVGATVPCIPASRFIHHFLSISRHLRQRSLLFSASAFSSSSLFLSLAHLGSFLMKTALLVEMRLGLINYHLVLSLKLSFPHFSFFFDRFKLGLIISVDIFLNFLILRIEFMGILTTIWFNIGSLVWHRYLALIFWLFLLELLLRDNLALNIPILRPLIIWDSNTIELLHNFRLVGFLLGRWVLRGLDSVKFIVDIFVVHFFWRNLLLVLFEIGRRLMKFLNWMKLVFVFKIYESYILFKVLWDRWRLRLFSLSNLNSFHCLSIRAHRLISSPMICSFSVCNERALTIIWLWLLPVLGERAITSSGWCFTLQSSTILLHLFHEWLLKLSIILCLHIPCTK